MELGLPIDAEGRDAQIEYIDSDGRTGRVNIEVASGNYRARSVRANAAALKLWLRENSAMHPWSISARLTAGLADLGCRVDLVERSVRRGEGDPGLARALNSDAEGDWD